MEQSFLAEVMFGMDVLRRRSDQEVSPRRVLENMSAGRVPQEVATCFQNAYEGAWSQSRRVEQRVQETKQYESLVAHLNQGLDVNDLFATNNTQVALDF